MIAALDWCVANGVQVANMSLGSSADPGITVQQACDQAAAAGVVLVAAAGNTGNPAGRGDKVGYPARYPAVIAVGATDSRDRRASFSSTGPDLELAAPGVEITSTYPDGRLAIMSGTSMAAPHVAGVAALVIASGVETEQVRSLLQSTADDLGDAGWDPRFGYGIVDADGAAGAPPPPPPPPPSEGTVHVADLDGAASAIGRSGKVGFSVTVTIHDEGSAPVPGAAVHGTWSGDFGGSVTGTTLADGSVTFSTGALRGATQVTFTVDDVQADFLPYDPLQNTDPDGDSDGTSIAIGM